MAVLICAVVGLLLGGSVFGVFGALAGALLGVVIGAIITGFKGNRPQAQPAPRVAQHEPPRREALHHSAERLRRVTRRRIGRSEPVNDARTIRVGSLPTHQTPAFPSAR